MILYILRHATAEEAAEGGDDGARKLTPRARDRMCDAAAAMRVLGLKFDAILTSPLVRAAETAEIISAAYNNQPAPQVLPALASGVAPAEVVSALKPFARFEDVMIVGHEPQLSSLASLLLSGSAELVHLRLKTGGCIALELPQRFDRGGAELRWMLTHRQLRRLRK
jgi:phosphohistidine phosphatase